MSLAHPIDRRRLTGYVTSPRTRYAISSAYSSKLNPRNLEVDYYPAYNHTLADLIDFEFEGALVVAPQYNLWLSKATFDLCKVPSKYFTKDGPDDEEDNAAVEGEEDLFSNGIPSPPASSSPPRAPVDSGRPKRDTRPPPSYPKDFLTSIRALAALTPSEGLTQQELEQALLNLATISSLSDETSDATEADTSMSTLDTVPEGRGKDLFPDFLLCHSYAVEVDAPGDESPKLFGWERRARCKVQHQCFPLIMEMKGCPARTLRGDKLTTSLGSLLASAAEELHDYVQAYFSRDVCAKCVIVMAAAGPYWQWLLVDRNDVGRMVPRLGLPVSPPTDSALLRSAFLDKLKKAQIFILSTNASDKELTRLRNDFLIPLIEDHYRYPSTVVTNPQRPKKGGNTAS